MAAYKCNICGLPGKIKYTERDDETGEIIEKVHNVPCLGHPYIRAHLWNGHPKYEQFRKRLTKTRKENERTD